jgi:hypothetical protein
MPSRLPGAARAVLPALILAASLAAAALAQPASSGTGSAGPAPSSAPAGIGEEQMRSLLRTRGFTDIEAMRREGDLYAGRATHHGETVEFEADARTGEIRRPESLTEGQIRTLLRGRGYTDFSDLRRDGNTYKTRALRNGRPMNLQVDARTGALLQQEILSGGEAGPGDRAGGAGGGRN